MAKVVVDYNDISDAAATIRDEGTAVKTNFNSLYSLVGGISGSWMGKRYTELVDIYNSEAVLNNCKNIVILIYDMADDLFSCTNKYSNAVGNGEAIASLGKISDCYGTEITSITPVEQTGMFKFVEEGFTAQNLNVINKLLELDNEIKSIKSTLTGIAWQSDGRTSFVNTYSTELDNASTFIKAIKEKHVSYVEKALADFRVSEESASKILNILDAAGEAGGPDGGNG